jgi:hypothetical protein
MDAWRGFEWVNGYDGSTPWGTDAGKSWDGLPSLRAGAIPNNGISTLATGVFTNTAPAMAWLLAVSSENNYDFLRVLVVDADSGSVLSTPVSISGNASGFASYGFDPAALGAGNYRLLFRYQKDVSSIGGADTGWMVPLEGFPLVVANALARAPAALGVPGARCAPQGRAQARAPAALGTPQGRAAPRARLLAVGATPLGSPQAGVAPRARARAAVASLLGAPRARARPVRLPAALVDATRPARPLADALPLRPAEALPTYHSAAAGRWLPWVYGRVTLAPVPLDAAGLEWLVADHPIVAVERVSIGGSPTTGWKLVQRLDATATAVAVLRLTQAPQAGQAIAVTVLGRRHPGTGAALEHPADIAADLLRHSGWPVTPDAFQGLRDAYPGLTLGLVLDTAQRLREALAAVIEPMGAVWRADPPAGTRRAPGQPVAVLDVATVDDIQASTDASQLAAIAHVRYGHDWAAGAARGALTLTAPDAVALYGPVSITLDLPAVRTARDALAIGSALLARRAQPMWSIELTVPDRLALAPGDTVTLAHPRVPQGAALVLSTAHDRARGTRTLSVELPAGTAPRIELTRRASAIDAAVNRDTVTYRDGVASFTVTDDNGAPLAGASVTLDGIETRETDRFGQVQFRTPRGAHTLTVVARGFAAFTLEVIV